MSNISLQVTGIDQVDLSIWNSNSVELLKSIDRWKNRDVSYAGNLHSQVDSYVVEDIRGYNRYLEELVSKVSKDEYFDESVFMEALQYSCGFWVSNQQILAIYIPFKKEIIL